MSNESNTENNCNSAEYFQEIIKSRDLEKIKIATDKCGVNTPNENGNTLLMEAVSEKKKEDEKLLEIVNMLLEMGENPLFLLSVNEYPSREFSSPINIAITKEHVEIVKLMINKSNLDVNHIVTNNQPTYLATACASCNIDMVKLLIEKGADVNKKSFDVFSLSIIMDVDQERKLEYPLQICLKTYYMLRRTHIFGGITDNEFKQMETKILDIIQILLDNGAFPDGHNDKNKESETIKYANDLRF